MTNELIKIEEKEGQQAVSARELYNYLEPKSNFDNWIKRMLTYGFEYDVDFSSFLTKSIKGRPKKEYALTVECAKEISMLQRSEKGKEARQYFIACEKKLQAGTNLLSSEVVALQQAKIKDLETKVKAIEARTGTNLNYFTVMGYASLTKQFVDVRTASIIGRKASAICKREKLKVTNQPDPRFGRVNQYPKPVLKRVFKGIAIF